MSTLSDLAKLIDLKADEACAIPIGGGGLRTHQLDIDPYDFLVQAEEDWELGGDASELNAITNAKRAIMCQMDQALLSFGYPATKWITPKKIEALNGLGLVAPRILRKVASARNLLEHEYRRPSKAEIEEALDLASLFVASVKPVLHIFGDQFLVGNRSEYIDQYSLSSFTRELDFSMSPLDEAAVFRVVARIHRGETRERVGETCLSWKDEAFPIVVRLAMAADRDFKLERAVDDFCKAVGIQ